MAERRGLHLSEQNLHRLPPSIACPDYNRHHSAGGIVHLGVGTSLRTGIAAYTDAALNLGGGEWTITAVSLRSPLVARRLAGQDGLYTLGTLGEEPIKLRVIGSIGRILVAGDDPKAVIEALAAPQTRIVSLTVTSEGYCRNSSGALDFARAHTHSIYFFLSQAFLERQRRGLPGITLLSCDNIPANGQKLRDLMCEYLALHEPYVLRWFVQQCTCPNTATAVPSSAPTLPDDPPAPDVQPHDILSKIYPFLRDQACAFRPNAGSWMVEDDFVQGCPDWNLVGAQLYRQGYFVTS